MSLHFYALLPADNPHLGNFQHAPPSTKNCNKFFENDIITLDEYLRLKALRHNPFTGQFHKGPKEYSDLHLRYHRKYNQRCTDLDMMLLCSNDKNINEINESKCNESVEKVNDVPKKLDIDKNINNILSLNDNKSSGWYIGVDPNNNPIETDNSSTNSNCNEYPANLDSSNKDNKIVLKKMRSFSNRAPISNEDNMINLPVVSSMGDLNGHFMKAANIEEYDYGTKFDADNSFDAKPKKLGKQLQVRTHSEGVLNEEGKYDKLYFSSNGAFGTPISNNVISSHKNRNIDAMSFSSSSTDGSHRINNNNTGSSYTLMSYDGDIPLSNGQNLIWIINRTLKITGRYKIDMSSRGSLGKGEYSIAKVCTDRTTGMKYAVKIIKKRMLVSKQEKAMIENEVKIHQVLHHSNIIKLNEIYEDESRLFLVLELATQGTFEKYLTQKGGKLPEMECQYFFSQLIDAVSYLHKHGVLQGDLKPANLLLEKSSNGHNNRISDDGNGKLLDWNWRLKLCDFGLSRKVPDVKFYKHTGDVHKVPYSGLCGTMGYIAPEIIKQEPYTIAVDIWSVGIILYEMLSGIKPFVPYKDCTSIPVQFPRSCFDTVSSDVPNLLNRLLTIDPLQRIKANQVLKHEWIATSKCMLK